MHEGRHAKMHRLRKLLNSLGCARVPESNFAALAIASKRFTSLTGGGQGIAQHLPGSRLVRVLFDGCAHVNNGLERGPGLQ